LALWVVSHCKTSSNREGYVKELQKYIEVDMFGKCNGRPLTCPEIGNCTDEMEKLCTNGKEHNLCVREVSLRYKFYLAFENSRCDNYWTEKLGQCFEVPIVPIVLGGADYTKIMPKEAYINVYDFENPQKLAEYLLYLDGNWVRPKK